MPTSSARSQHAFTLIELLVTVVIIGILVAILLPTISMVRMSAHTVSCQNNMRQTGLAVFAYAQDNRGRTPFAGDTTLPRPLSSADVSKQLMAQVAIDYEYIYAGIGLDLLLEMGYVPRDRKAANIFFCPALPFRTGHSRYTNTPVYGSGDNGRDDVRTMMAAPDMLNDGARYQYRWQMPGYIMRNKNADKDAATFFPSNSLDWSFKLAAENASKTAYLSDRTHVGTYGGPTIGTNAPFEFKTYHRSGWNVWYLDGSTRLVTDSGLSGPALSGNNGSHFRALDRK